MQNATLSKFVIIVVVVVVKHSARHKFHSFTQWETQRGAECVMVGGEAGAVEAEGVGSRVTLYKGRGDC